MTWLTRDVKPSLKRGFLREHADRLAKNGGVSPHSAAGTTLRFELEVLEEKQVPYTLTAHPGMGYVVEVKK